VSAIGGFLELETRRGAAGAWHCDALPLTSGRACFRAILEVSRPSKVFVPFYICECVLEPIRRLQIPFEFYGLTPSLEADRLDWPAGAAVLTVNYFDLKNRHVDRLALALGRRAIVDDTQAFFRRRRHDSFSFNSARKFFGVPDGAYAYGHGLRTLQPADRNDAAACDHLATRLGGDMALAYRQYQAAESEVTCEILAPSRRAEDLLASVAYDEARVSRRRNFEQLHESLGALNALALDCELDDDAAPSCYPFLPSRPSLHEALWQREIFVPRLWPEVATRPAPGFMSERDLATRLLPLPVDHRYGAEDMQRVCDVVREVVR